MSFDHTLVAALQAAVPLRIAELQRLQGETRTLQALKWARMAADPIASRSDILLYVGGKRGEAAEVFGHMARGLAALAHNPGGILFAGTHWCIEHPYGLNVASIVGLRCGSAGMDPLPDGERQPSVRRPIVTVTLPEPDELGVAS